MPTRGLSVTSVAAKSWALKKTPLGTRIYTHTHTHTQLYIQLAHYEHYNFETRELA